MRFITWMVRLVLFVVLIALAAKNVEPVTLRFYFDLALRAPLVAVLFGAFAAGALFGILALVPALLRQRRQIALLKRKPADAADKPPVVPPI